MAVALFPSISGHCEPISSRIRSDSYAKYEPPDANLQGLVDVVKRHTGNPAILNSALATLADLTSWKSQNQLGVVDTDGLDALLGLIRRAASFLRSQRQMLLKGAHPGRQNVPPSPPSATPIPNLETPKLALWVLMNLASNDLLSPRISSTPGCVEDLVELLLSQDVHCGIYAGRCLVNLVQARGKAADAAVSAGILNIISHRMESSDDEASRKVDAWMLCSLTSSHRSTARMSVAADANILMGLQQMVKSKTVSSVPSAILAASALGNISKGGSSCQDMLTRTGSTKTLMAALISATDPKLVAAIVEALSALALGHKNNSMALLAEPRLMQRMEAIMEQSVKRSIKSLQADEGRMLLAVHLLMYILARHRSQEAAYKGKQQQQHKSSPCTGNKVVAVDRPAAASGNHQVKDGRPDSGMHVTTAAAVVTLRSPAAAAAPPLMYMSLEEAAGLLQIKLPTPGTQPGRSGVGARGATAIAVSRLAAAEQSPYCGDPDSSLVMLFEELAELQHTLHDVLLPRSREPNATASTGAVVLMYQLAVGNGCSGSRPHANKQFAAPERQQQSAALSAPAGVQAAATRILLAEASLIGQLVALLSGKNSSGELDIDSRLLIACLSLLDVISGEEGCRRLLVEAGWLEAVEPLLGSPDALVRMLAERALCSMHACEF
ncbi:hypothetical protein CEUSTIGMA_g9926.t1 [Chlamydomonas eustigma]|uniref:Armadillo repeat-containing domain-containing protein n=1 Tax=Chlamydomonas eustigma TaxID=1157962 RepID=A0A250XHV1_9CHLO|nr:hypothetical protein CEUSTIGMA_g9926.t1 [Chlamydomonas eustigma]|eukprot:GAX82499.1 hypothetical protein CEUSTIGMA_g9926.t1 [Chlamydomonas eustigma]